MLDLQGLAQLLESARKPGVDRADRELERTGDLLRRHAHPVAQDDHHAALEREIGHRREQAPITDRVGGCGVGKIRKLLVGETTLRAQEVERPVGHDPVQPRPERAMLVETPERGERTLEPVRSHVVRKRTASGDGVRRPPRIAPVAPEERRSGFSVAVPRPPYEIPVTWFTHSFAVLYERAAFARPARGILLP